MHFLFPFLLLCRSSSSYNYSMITAAVCILTLLSITTTYCTVSTCSATFLCVTLFHLFSSFSFSPIPFYNSCHVLCFLSLFGSSRLFLNFCVPFCFYYVLLFFSGLNSFLLSFMSTCSPSEFSFASTAGLYSFLPLFSLSPWLSVYIMNLRARGGVHCASSRLP